MGRDPVLEAAKFAQMVFDVLANGAPFIWTADHTYLRVHSRVPEMLRDIVQGDQTQTVHIVEREDPYTGDYTMTFSHPEHEIWEA